VRPSEKTALRVMSGFSPLSHPSLDSLPRRGGLRTPAMRELTSPEHVPSRPPGVHLPPVIMICPGLRMALPRGRTECVPPRKTPLASSPGPSPLGKPRWGGPPRGGAGSARPQGRHSAAPKVASFWPPAHRKRTGENVMPRLESGLATRTHGVRPSEKTTLRVSPGSSPLGRLPLARLPGGAGSACPQTRLCFHRGIAPLGHQTFVCPR
jgi:hypothetical protein